MPDDTVHVVWLKSWQDTGETEIYTEELRAVRLGARRAEVPDSVLKRFHDAQDELDAADRALWACVKPKRPRRDV